MHRALPLAVGTIIVACALIAPPCAEAQGKGRPKTPKVGTTPSPTPTPTGNTTSSPSPTPTPAPTPTPTPSPTPTPTAASATTAVGSEILPPVTTFRQFGAWLDDASAMNQGDGYVSVGAGHWRLPVMTQTNMPMLGAGVGLTDRFQVNAYVPFYRYNFQGVTASGMDDIYLGAKYTIVDPTLTISEVGLAVSPIVEVLSADVPDGRVHFAVPVTVEVRRLPFRVYGSAGYFTRGSFFTGGAVEWTAPNGVILTGALTQSYSMKEDTVLDTLAVARQRVDVAGGVAHAIGNSAVAYMSIGRSLRSPDGESTSLALVGGVSFRFSTKSTP